MKNKIYEMIDKYIPNCMQEEIDKKLILSLLDKYDNLLYRSNNVAHFTTSSFIVNPSFTKGLFIHHNIYNSWSWVGGHNDGDDNFINVAIKEAKEETGVDVKVYNNKIYAIDVLGVNSHIKNNNFISSHLHLNITYLCIANEEDQLILNNLETNGIKWFYFDDFLENVAEHEKHMIPVYKKLISKLSTI